MRQRKTVYLHIISTSVPATHAYGGEWSAKQTQGAVLIRKGTVGSSGKETKGKVSQKLNPKNWISGKLVFPLSKKRCDAGQLLLAAKEALNR